MQLILYKNFNKRKNSTKQPTGGVTYDIALKDVTSLRNPTFKLAGLDATTDTYNYAWWNNRYYFIDDIDYVHEDLFYVHCSIDVLATYKTYIGQYAPFVERSASAYNSMIHDPLVSGRQDIENRRTVSTDTTNYMNRTGFYIVQTVAGVGTTSTSGINSYALEKSQLGSLLNYAFDESHFTGMLADEAVKAVFNPADYIISIKWVPFVNISTFSGSSSREYIKLGWWTTDALGYSITTQAYAMIFTVNRPSAYFPDFRNNDPTFTKLQLWLPGVGLVDVDSRYNSANLYAMYYVDTLTGGASVYLKSGTSQANHIIATYQANLSAEIKIAQSSLDLQGLTSDVISGTANLFAQNYAGAVASLVDVIPTLGSPTTNSIGSQGNIASITAYMDIYCTVTCYGSGGIPQATCGRPLMREQTINTMSGFIKCGNASISIPGQSADRDEINSYLNSGFFYE